MNPLGCRSKFSILPQQIRWHAYNLLLDGATLKSLLGDPIFSKALNQSGITFSDNNLKYVRRSREFAEFTRMRQKFLKTKYQDMMLSSIIKRSGALESMTDQTKCKLMETLSELTDLSDLPNEERIKAVRSLSQSIASLSNPEKCHRIAELQRKLREKEEQLHAAEERWKVREAELLTRIMEQENRQKAASGMSRETLEEVENKIKLM